MFRAKVFVQELKSFGYHGKKLDGIWVSMVPVMASEIPEDQRFNQATPAGKIELQINNPAVVAQLEAGKEFYVDFTEVPKA